MAAGGGRSIWEPDGCCGRESSMWSWGPGQNEFGVIGFNIPHAFQSSTVPPLCVIEEPFSWLVYPSKEQHVSVSTRQSHRKQTSVRHVAVNQRVLTYTPGHQVSSAYIYVVYSINNHELKFKYTSHTMISNENFVLFDDLISHKKPLPISLAEISTYRCRLQRFLAVWRKNSYHLVFDVRAISDSRSRLQQQSNIFFIRDNIC
jgi:hypothetical protein